MFEVLDSPWLREMRDQNRVAFPESSFDGTTRHFVLTFHEVTVELLVTSLEAQPATEERRAEFQRLAGNWGIREPLPPDL